MSVRCRGHHFDVARSQGSLRFSTSKSCSCLCVVCRSHRHVTTGVLKIRFAISSLLLPPKMVPQLSSITVSEWQTGVTRACPLYRHLCLMLDTAGCESAVRRMFVWQCNVDEPWPHAWLKSKIQGGRVAKLIEQSSPSFDFQSDHILYMSLTKN